MSRTNAVLDDRDVLKLLRSRVRDAGGQAAFARQLGMNRLHLNRMVNGKKVLGSIILGPLNLRILFTPVGRRGRADGRNVPRLTKVRRLSRGCCKARGHKGIDMLGSYVRALDGDELLELLRSRVKSVGGQSAFSRLHRIERTYLNQVLSGKKPPGGPSILDALNLRIVYAPAERRGR